MAPDCEISARSPVGGMRAAKLALSFAPGHQHAEAIGADQAHAVRARRALGGFGQRARAVAEPGGDDDRAGATSLARGRDQAGDRGGR